MDLPHKTSVAYAITVTDCTPTIFDAAAVLAKSIRTTQQHYSYDLIAILHHVQARDCQQGLEYLGYQVMLKDVPFRLEELKARNRIELGRGGCCGISEYLKLYAVSLTQYDVVLHLDVDAIVLQPLDPLIDVVLREASSKYTLRTIPSSYSIPDEVDFLYTRDYNTVNKNDPTNRLKNGVQGAFFVVKPSTTRFEDLLRVVKTTDFDRSKGWNRSGFGGYWGSAQIQGLFSYYYFLHPETTAELHHCWYNTLGIDMRYLKGSNDTICRTGETSPVH